MPDVTSPSFLFWATVYVIIKWGLILFAAPRTSRWWWKRRQRGDGPERSDTLKAES